MLLPQKFSPTGTYRSPNGVTVRALSFRVLCHAEIEQYFEDRAVEIAKTALSSWKSSRHLCSATFSLLAFSGIVLEKPPATLKPKPKDQKDWPSLLSPDQRLRDSVTQYVHFALHENHGIREHNLLSLLLPIGIPADSIDDVFVADLDDFGKQRGETAHSTTKGQVKYGINPEAEYKRVQALLSGLKPIDGELDKALNEAKIKAI
jgi:hypothetical protein